MKISFQTIVHFLKSVVSFAEKFYELYEASQQTAQTSPPPLQADPAPGADQSKA